MSKELQSQFQERLQSSAMSMLPSYNYHVPSGKEQGQYLALDVGGSTLRVAMVQLRGRWCHDGSPMVIKYMRSFQIDDRVKASEGRAFFDWMADRVDEVLAEDRSQPRQGKHPLSMGLAWSFPIKQTSRKTGTVLGMGKGFHASQGVIGQDLEDLFTEAFRRKVSRGRCMMTRLPSTHDSLDADCNTL
jgi:hexokinase